MSERLSMGGVFTATVHEHEMIARAMESGDPEEFARTAQFIRDRGWVDQHYGYYEKAKVSKHNLIPTAGINNCWDVWLGGTAKSAAWYIPLITSNSTPTAGWLSNWAGASSGPVATELPNASYDESNRQAATFGSAATGGVLTTSAATRYTLSAGVSGVSIYGACLTNVATVAYNATDKILAAATRFDSAITGLAATHKIDLEYELTGTSS